MPFSDFITPTGVLPLEQVDMVPPEWAAPPLQPQLGATLATEINQGIVAPDYPPLPWLQSGVLFFLAADMVGPDHPTPRPKFQSDEAIFVIRNFVEPDHPTPPPRFSAQLVSTALLGLETVDPDHPPKPRLQAGVLIRLSADIVDPDHPPLPPKLYAQITLPGAELVEPDHPPLPPRPSLHSSATIFVIRNFVGPDHPTPPPAK